MIYLKNTFNRTLALTLVDGTTLRVAPQQTVQLGNDKKEITAEMIGKQDLGHLIINEKNVQTTKKSKLEKEEK